MADSLRISLSNFRAFAETGPINIKPLTILVGENSTGKTSFLAALRYCFNLAERGKAGYFNTPPFDLGSYEDIVHQSGQPSTTLRFSITIDKDVDIARQGSIIFNPQAKSDVTPCKLTVFFRSLFGEVALSGFLFCFEDVEVDYKSGSKGGFTVRKSGAILPQPPRQGSFGFDDSKDLRFEGLREVSYRLFNLFYMPSANPSRAAQAKERTFRRIAQAFDAFVTSSYVMYSSPPVRSVPRRVYTSSDEVGFSDQSHAPHELNRLKRADRRRWGRLNTGLTSFGRLSGLFTRFDITKLTRQDAGPFQLKVTVRGRSANIADVGYGVSQALPIMTELIESSSDKSVFLFQQPEVHLHPRAQAALGTIFSNHISGNLRSYIITETHSDYLIDRVRIECRKGTMPPELVNILYFESLDNDVRIHELSCDREGNVINAPPSYREFFIREQEEVLGI